MVMYVIIGVVLIFLGFYELLVKFVVVGVIVFIIGFGYLFVIGVIKLI